MGVRKPQQKCFLIQQWLYLQSILLLCTWGSSLYADEKQESYEFELTPYLWAASISGTTAVSDDGSPPVESPPIDSDYSFFSLDNLDGVASATFTARKKQWAFLFDFLYVAYEDTFFEGGISVVLNLNKSVLISVLYLSLGSSVLAYYLLNYNLRHLPTYKVAIFANLIPVVTVFASWVIYGEWLNLRQLLGALVVILGVYLTYYRFPREMGGNKNPSTR